jgi:hypothetical protein
MFIGLGLFLVAVFAKSEHLKQAGYVLFALLAIIVIPVYLSGNAADQAIREMPGLSRALVESHEGAAMVAFLFMWLTGILSLAGLWQYTRPPKSPAQPGHWQERAVLFSAILTAIFMGIAGNTGGHIRHPEVLVNGQVQPSATAAVGEWIVKESRYFVIEYSRWIWPIVEDLHFIGLIMLMAAVGTLNLRMLGFFKKLPVAALHRFMPMGIAGLVINILTGFLFFIGMPYFYVFNLFFHAKIAAVALAGTNLILFHCTPAFRSWENVGPGDGTPIGAKLVAASSIVLWLAVIIIGRYIPLGESPF